MSICFVGSPEEEYIVKGEEEELEKALNTWSGMFDRLNDRNFRIYQNIYRGRLDIPQDIDSEEEKEMIFAEYGDKPNENDRFLELMKQARQEYEEVREELPDWRSWFEEKGFETISVDHVIKYN